MSPEQQAIWERIVKDARAQGWLRFHHDGVLVIIRPPEAPPPAEPPPP